MSRHARELADGMEEKLRKATRALKPFADRVFNDNHDMTVNTAPFDADELIDAYFAWKKCTDHLVLYGKISQMHPSDKEELAQWMGYDSVSSMDADHDRLHELLSDLLAVPSYSMKVKNGENLTHSEWMIANYEEDAVLNVQRWLQQLRKL